MGNAEMAPHIYLMPYPYAKQALLVDGATVTTRPTVPGEGPHQRFASPPWKRYPLRGTATELKGVEKTRVYIADRHPLYREGVRRALSAYPDISVWGDGPPDNSLVAVIEANPPGVLLLDIDPPGLNGLNLARQVKKRSPGTGIIILGPYWDDEHLFQAIRAGAAGYASKDITPAELADLVRRVGRGQYPINDTVLTRPHVASRVLHQFQEISVMGKEVEEFFSPLSPRETEVLTYVASGYSNKEIARILKLSEQTIKNHITSILRKLDANDRTQAVVRALREGWIPLKPESPQEPTSG